MDTPVEVDGDLLNKTVCDNVVKEGKGFKIYSDNAIEYKYVNNLNILLERLWLISAQESAGHNNFHNEKITILKFIMEEFKNIINSKNGVEYLIKLIPVISEKKKKYKRRRW